MMRSFLFFLKHHMIMLYFCFVLPDVNYFSIDFVLWKIYLVCWEFNCLLQYYLMLPAPRQQDSMKFYCSLGLGLCLLVEGLEGPFPSPLVRKLRLEIRIKIEWGSFKKVGGQKVLWKRLRWIKACYWKTPRWKIKSAKVLLGGCELYSLTENCTSTSFGVLRTWELWTWISIDWHVIGT